MVTEHTVGFEPADRLAKDRESVRKRFWIKLKRVRPGCHSPRICSRPIIAPSTSRPRAMCRRRCSAPSPISSCRSISFRTCCRCSASPTMPRCSPPRSGWSPAHITPEHRDAARAALKRVAIGRDGSSSRESCNASAASPQGCRITLPIALRPASTFRASAVCASGKVRSTCDEILPSAVHFTSFSRLARFFSGLSRAQ